MILFCETLCAEPSWLITCHNCGHGSDLRGCPQSPLQLEGTAFIKHFLITQIDLTHGVQRNRNYI
mgnify:CR=1 FL=1